MKTVAIRIEGQILSPEVLDRIESGDIKGQNSADFGFEKNDKVKDRIQLAWADAKDQWSIFKRRIENIAPPDTGTTETRKYWIVPLLENLGYQLTPEKSAEVINGDTFAISHRATNLGGFPIHITGVNDSLDKRRETGGLRLSPHALLQEYLNRTDDYLYGIVTNGYQLRVLRDSGKLIKLSYLEFDLFRMLEDDLYAEFSIMYRLIHASRMPRREDENEASIFENYHQDSLEAGSRIREKLSEAVELSILLVGKGFLKNPHNTELRDKLRNGSLSESNYYKYLLRFIYRILFLLVIEERDIVYPEELPVEKKKLRDIYLNYYSITRIRALSEKIFLFDENLEDAWISLRNTFKLFCNELLGAKLGIYPLGGDLFDTGSIGILEECSLDNNTLLRCIKNLSEFEHRSTHNAIKVNYAALNVEEFGSVYEGLLEKSPEIKLNGNDVGFTFVAGNERAASGSHYTPEELVQPLIKHSLEYVIEDKLRSVKSKEEKEAALLSIKVCDVACGSGHILLSAARKLAVELARVRTGEDQPSPAPYRQAQRDVIIHCIYGVDKNPLAVELCKVALWLEAYNPGMPLSFLDHRIKCGDSIVGLARKEELFNGISEAAFKRMPGDDPDTVKYLLKKHKNEIKGTPYFESEAVSGSLSSLSVNFAELDAMPEHTLEDVKLKAERYNEMKGREWWNLREAADLQVAQFFIPKTETEAENIATYSDYVNAFTKEKSRVRLKIAKAMAVSSEKKFFHWFLEFPEVMQEGGFDCILGNPPFLGGQRLSGTFGDAFLNWVKTEYAPAGSCDLVTYFFRRIYTLLKTNGYQSLIATNTIAQGGAREGGLEVIMKDSGTINFAVRSMKWPGVAAVEVALVTIHKGKFTKNFYIGNKKVNYISPYLDDTKSIGNPYPLKQNEGKSFQGSIVLGKGFILTPAEAQKLIARNPKNKDVLFPYLNGEDLNSNPDQNPSRWVINFFDWDEDYCRKNYPDCFEIVERLVKPERTRKDANGNYELRKPLPQKWWIYAEKRPALYNTIRGMERVLVINNHTKYHVFELIPANLVFSHALSIICFDGFLEYGIMSSSILDYWAWKNGSKLGSETLRYTSSTCFQNFPLPSIKDSNKRNNLFVLGEKLYNQRKSLLLNYKMGLTALYNEYHLTNIKKAHSETRNSLSITFGIEELRKIIINIDSTLLSIYGWDDIILKHNFYEVDYLPDESNIRFTISQNAAKEVYVRLLELNHKIHDEEVKAGLWDKPKTKRTTKKSADPGQEGLFR